MKHTKNQLKVLKILLESEQSEELIEELVEDGDEPPELLDAFNELREMFEVSV